MESISLVQKETAGEVERMARLILLFHFGPRREQQRSSTTVKQRWDQSLLSLSTINPTEIEFNID